MTGRSVTLKSLGSPSSSNKASGFACAEWFREALSSALTCAGRSQDRRLVDAAKDNQWLLPSGVATLLSVHDSRQQYPTPSRATIAANAGSSARNFLRIFLTSALTFTR